MRVLYSPQRNDDKINYSFEKDKIIAEYKGLEDIFDFSLLPDGKLDYVETTLEVNPVRAAERINGELQVILLYFHGPNATVEELNPDWQVVE
ncbi:hypothetical protein [Paucisalibacillus globulus]|uniref:hypothetical protein n=1 Tax=Paucisalibacillus globulus TaxID=351095 RepID=UPI000BB753A6|nr:hypothetical protein [Paucisalibacillus globulus]